MSDEWLTYKTGYDNRTLRHLVGCNDLVGVRYKIFEKGADVNSKEGRPDAPIHVAALLGNHEILKVLIEAGADVNIRYNYTGQTPIFMAKDARTAEILVEAGAKLNVQDKKNYQPLHSLIREKNIFPVIEYLVSRAGADVNARTGSKNVTIISGMSPLELACNFRFLNEIAMARKHSFKIIKFLIKNGANVNNINMCGETPLRQLLRYHKPLKPEFVKIFHLVLRYSDISVNHFGSIMSVSWFNQKLCEILLEHVAVLLSLGVALNSHEDLIKNYHRANLRDHFEKSKSELVQAKSKKIGDSWVTLYNLLTDNKRKLKNYAGNHDLVKSFRGTNFTNEFPIYGKQIMEKMEKGIRIRKLYEESCNLFSYHSPIFDSYHLIVRDVLDCLTCSTKDMAKFCTK